MIGTRCEHCGNQFELRVEDISLQIDIDSPLSILMSPCPECDAQLIFQLRTDIAVWLAWAGVETQERFPLKDIRDFLMTLNNDQAFQAELDELLGDDE